MSLARPSRLLPTRRGWGVLVLAVAAWLGWLLVGLREAQMLAVLLVVALPLAVLLLVVGALRTPPRALLGGIAPTVEAGSEVWISARVVAHWSVEPDLDLVWALEHPGSPTHPVEGVTTTARVGETSRLRVWARRRGRLRVALVEVSATDPLGLARLRVRTSTHVDVLVLPPLFPTGHLPEALGDLGTHGVRPGAGEPGGSLRDYRSGDAPRSIHWKQSARQGRLLVNVPESGGGTSHRLALVTDPAAYGGERAGVGRREDSGSAERGQDAEFERAVSVAATLVSQWCARGGEVSLTVGVPRGRTLTSHDVGLHLRALAELPSLDHGSRTADLPLPVGHPPLGQEPPSAVVPDDASERATVPGEPSGDPEPLPPGCLVVTGRISPALRAVMGRTPSGVVVLTGDSRGPREGTLPRGWDVVRAGSPVTPGSGVPPRPSGPSGRGMRAGAGPSAPARPSGAGGHHG